MGPRTYAEGLWPQFAQYSSEILSKVRDEEISCSLEELAVLMPASLARRDSPRATMENRRVWWNLIASAGLASEEAGLCTANGGMLRSGRDARDRAECFVETGRGDSFVQLPYVETGWDAFRLVTAVTADSAAASDLGKLLWRCPIELCLNEGERGGSAPELRSEKFRFAQERGIRSPSSRYQASGWPSLRSTASSTRCCAFFRKAAQSRHFPQMEEAVLARPSFFATGVTFAVYLAHLGEACLLLGIDNKRETKSVATAGHGLAMAGDSGFSPRPAAS